MRSKDVEPLSTDIHQQFLALILEKTGCSTAKELIQKDSAGPYHGMGVNLRTDRACKPKVREAIDTGYGVVEMPG
ncbi:hypothetical protein GYA49_00645 [Candidatus Beckwithbacteria bacterium]|nr:hypothetical protein [Candidatus Beckwithbacteria bacterium]